MPTYSYKCTACDNAFDIRQSFSDEALTTCPECGGRLRKVFSPVGVTFNGSGFYRTDSRAGNGSKKEKTTSDSSSGGSGGSSSGGSSGGSASSGSTSGSSTGSGSAGAKTGSTTA